MAYVEVDIDLTHFDDSELISELKNRGYIIGIGGKLYNESDKLMGLYTTYLTMPRDFFDKELRKYFSDNLNVYLS
jgi:hypothetical protein